MTEQICEGCLTEEATHDISIKSPLTGRNVKRSLCVECATKLVESLAKSKESEE